MRPLRTLTLAALTAAIVATGALSSTTAAFTSSATVATNTATTATLEAPDLTPGSVTAGSITTSWTPAPTGGTPAEYVLTRTLPDGSNPTEIYRGSDTSYTDPGNLPAGLRTQPIIQIAGGTWHSVALASDGTAWAWGINNLGQLGNDTRANQRVPVQVQPLPGGRTITAVAAGAYHSLALASDGTAWSWGYNAYGQLGDGTTLDRNVPVQVQPLPGGRTVTAVAAGAYHSLALASDGTAWTWGNNVYGQLGNASYSDRSAPVQVQPLPGGRTVIFVTAGAYHSLAVASDGTAWAWGMNSLGQLGDGTTTANQRVPVQVRPLPGGRTITTVAGGVYHSLALASDGTAWAWGSNEYGQLGDETTEDHSVPVQVRLLPGGRTVSSIAAGAYHSLAVASDGTAWAWGSNPYGQVGDGTNTSRNAPVLVQPLPDGRTISAIALGAYNSSLAVASDGTAWAWGYNDYGQLGDGTNTSRSTPTQVQAVQTIGCPTGSTLQQDRTTCSLRAGTEYSYTVTTTVGEWNATSELARITTTDPS